MLSLGLKPLLTSEGFKAIKVGVGIAVGGTDSQQPQTGKPLPGHQSFGREVLLPLLQKEGQRYYFYDGGKPPIREVQDKHIHMVRIGGKCRRSPENRRLCSTDELELAHERKCEGLSFFFFPSSLKEETKKGPTQRPQNEDDVSRCHRSSACWNTATNCMFNSEIGTSPFTEKDALPYTAAGTTQPERW